MLVGWWFIAYLRPNFGFIYLLDLTYNVFLSPPNFYILYFENLIPFILLMMDVEEAVESHQSFAFALIIILKQSSLVYN